MFCPSRVSMVLLLPGVCVRGQCAAYSSLQHPALHISSSAKEIGRGSRPSFAYLSCSYAHAWARMRSSAGLAAYFTYSQFILEATIENEFDGHDFQ